MTSLQIHEQRVKSAIFPSDILPVGQPVVVRIPHWKLTSSRNRAAVSIRYFQSAAPTPPGSGNWRGELKPLSALRAFLSSNRDLGWSMNLFGPYQAARRSFRALLKFCQEPSRRFTNALHVLPCVVAHEQQRSEGNLSWVTRNMLRVTKCL